MTADGDGCDLSYLNCPFLSPADYLQALSCLGVRHSRSSAGPRRSNTQSLTPLDRLFLPLGRYTRYDVEQAKSLAFGWEAHGFSDREVRLWLEAGLGPSESGLAALLVEEGITPVRLYEPCRHKATKECLPLLDVARLLPQSRAYEPDATLCDLLDEWNVTRDRRRTPSVPRFAARWARQGRSA